jgi:hypothetical protein
MSTLPHPQNNPEGHQFREDQGRWYWYCYCAKPANYVFVAGLDENYLPLLSLGMTSCSIRIFGDIPLMSLQDPDGPYAEICAVPSGSNWKIK